MQVFKMKQRGVRMIKTRTVCSRILGFFLFLCGAFILLPKIADGREEYPVTRVSVILPHADDGYWSLVEAGILSRQAEIGETYNIDISVIMPQMNYNIDQMIDMIKQQIAAQVDVLVVQGAEQTEYQEILRKAWEAGIRIICIDTDIEDFPEHLYVGTDNYAAGRLLGEQLVQLTDGKAHLAVISGKEGYSNLEQRMAGLLDVIKDYPDLKIEGIRYDKYDGLTVMQLYQELKEAANVTVYLEGTGGITLASLYQESDDTYEYIVGFDAYEGVSKGVLDGVVKQDTQSMGTLVVDEIANYIVTGSYSAQQIYTDIIWVNTENYDEVIP